MCRVNVRRLITLANVCNHIIERFKSTFQSVPAPVPPALESAEIIIILVVVVVVLRVLCILLFLWYLYFTGARIARLFFNDKYTVWTMEESEFDSCNRKGSALLCSHVRVSNGRRGFLRLALSIAVIKNAWFCIRYQSCVFMYLYIFPHRDNYVHVNRVSPVLTWGGLRSPKSHRGAKEHRMFLSLKYHRGAKEHRMFLSLKFHRGAKEHRMFLSLKFHRTAKEHRMDLPPSGLVQFLEKTVLSPSKVNRIFGYEDFVSLKTKQHYLGRCGRWTACILLTVMFWCALEFGA
jgi:hypothetical protein